MYTNIITKYIVKAFHQPLKKTFSMMVDKIYRLRMQRRNKQISLREGSYSKGVIGYHSVLSMRLSNNYFDKYISFLADKYLCHHFDLLGSGWRDVSFEAVGAGVEGYRYASAVMPLARRINPSNRTEALAIAVHLSADYAPIDWQRDFKSGYRWSEDTWYTDIQYGTLPGVDIKVPWELSRMQHLPILAYAHMTFDDSRYRDEFINEITDWVSSNPPGFGVNWRCTMDVGIRVANWLVTMDMFKGMGTEFPAWFDELFARSVYSHAQYIARNLEYSPALCSNHYLSDIAGLFFATAHLAITEETTGWMAFALQEIVQAMHDQFQEDGSNFEGSTSYHRLSTEIMLYCTALGIGLSDKWRRAVRCFHGKLFCECAHPALHPLEEQEYDLQNRLLFPDWYYERLYKACEFTKNLLYDGHHVDQIGDNDSGRFLKLHPVYRKISSDEAIHSYRNLAGREDLSDSYWDEDILDHTHIVNISDWLFGSEDENDIEVKVFASLCHGNRRSDVEFVEVKQNLKRMRKNSFSCSMTSDQKTFATWKRKLDHDFLERDKQVYIFSGKQLRKGMKVFPYPDFGLYIYQSDHIHMTIRAGSIGQNGIGGHAHNDQLSMTLHIDERTVIADPGTYLYTPLPERRNEFRSTRAHFTVQKDGVEQNAWLPGVNGLFSLQGDRTKSKILFLGQCGLVTCHFGYGEPVYRIIEIQNDVINVYDYGKDIVRWNGFLKYSNGYGKLKGEEHAF